MFLVEHKSPRFKRTANDPRQRKRSKLTAPNENGKNALVSLYGVQPSIEFKFISQAGPLHRPTFTIAVEINGQTFEGTGQTKKEAKQAGSYPFEQ